MRVSDTWCAFERVTLYVRACVRACVCTRVCLRAGRKNISPGDLCLFVDCRLSVSSR